MVFSTLTSDMTDSRWYGSKAATLSRVSRGGIRVPPGWVLNVQSVSRILAERGFTVHQLGVKIEEADDVYGSLASPPSVQLYGELLQSVTDILRSTQGGRWAVRSSHPLEDEARASFAGLFRTELNVVRAGDLMRACLRCIQHGFSAPITAYCKAHHIEYLPPTAVLLQPLLLCTASGVLAKQEHNTIVHANWGLCYSVVNGLCAPDEWFCSSPSSNIEFRMGPKEVAVLPWMLGPFAANTQDVPCDALPGRPKARVAGRIHCGRLVVAELPEELRIQPCMNEEHIDVLLDLSRQIEDLTGLRELDIEWCRLTSGQICILQIRALTAKIMRSSNAPVEGALCGIPIVQGTAVGPAHRVETEAQAMEFPPGGVLVAEELAGPSLRAMQKACACVLPTRSILSHSAIIARESQLPTVGNISHAMIRDGETYRVNGTEGWIHAEGTGHLGTTELGTKHKARDDTRERRIEFRAAEMLANLLWDGNRVVLPFKSPIVWFRESYHRGITVLPKIYFGRPSFKDCSIMSDHVEIDSREWTEFFLLLTKALRDDVASRRILTANMERRLVDYRTSVQLAEERWRNPGQLSELAGNAKELVDQLTSFSDISAFSFLNFSLPVNWIRSVLASVGVDANGVSIDDFLVSKVTPHRILLRRAKVELALQKQREGILSRDTVDRFRTNAAPYEFFVEWCIDDSFLTNDRLMLREIDRMAATMAAGDLEEEMRYMDANRQRCVERRRGSLAEVVGCAERRYGDNEARNVGELLEFLSSVTTQEEERHMLQTRHLIVLGRLVRALDIDAAEAGLDDILFAARARWGT